MITFNPLPAVTYQNVVDLNAACRPKRTKTRWQVNTFKCPLKKKGSLSAHTVTI
jgi:hypothetical protein